MQGDQRTHSSVVALRAVTSGDGMTADWCESTFFVVSHTRFDLGVQPSASARACMHAAKEWRVRAVQAQAAEQGVMLLARRYPFEPRFLQTVSARICNAVRSVNRVVYDVTSKPPGTIEWE